MFDRSPKAIAMLSLLFLLVSVVTAFAAVVPPPPGGSCYKCVIVSGEHYDCRGGYDQGAVSCSVGPPTSCSVSGICGFSNGSLEFFAIAISPEVIREVADLDPRLAATIASLAADGRVETSGFVFWLPSEISTAQVERMLMREDPGLKALPGKELIYEYRVGRGPGGDLELVVTPERGSDLEKQSLGVVMKLQSADSDKGVFQVTNEWFLF